MKKILSIASIALVMTACTSTTDPNASVQAQLQAYKDSIQLAADTAGLAQFQQWKAQNELMETQQYQQMQAAAVAPAPVRSYAPARTSNRTYSSTRSRNTGGSMSNTSSNTAKRNTGWSKAAKGTAIGAGTGAVLGAVINKKNRVVGGVVGGVIGGGVGYGIGRGMDKRDGRY